MKNKLPNKLKIGLKLFGVIIGVGLLSGTVQAILKPSKGNPLPVSKISDEFPKSYQRYIDKLKEVYPNATFKAVYTGLNWDTVLERESYDKSLSISLVPKSYSDAWKKTTGSIAKDGSFVTASKSAVAYVLDPRNSLFEKRIFQFEGLTYNESITTSVIEKVIASSPMVGTYAKKYKNAGKWIDMDLSYAEIIDKVGKETKVSSVYIASRMIQETSGDIVNNGSINGSNATYPGVYNFFNIGATPNEDGTGSVTNGLKHAKSQGWTTPYLSILGGVKKIKASYIDWGQDTVYFQKFDVNNPYGTATWLMGTQYQTNILAPISESTISYNAYKKLDMLDTAFVFYIPVYENMPEDPTPYPAGDTAKFEDDNTKVYLDDIDTKGTDIFNIRTSANTEIENIICKVTESSSNPDEHLIMTRVKKGNGYDWDKVVFELNGEKIEGYVWSEYVQVYDYTKVENVTLDKETLELEVDDKHTLVATVTPDTARFKEVIWTSSNNEVLTVENGVITAVAPGEVVVTVTTEDQSKTAICTVKVKEKTYDIKTDLEEYIVEEGKSITPVVTLKNIEDYELKIEDETIAKVVDKTVEGLIPGETNLVIKGSNVEVTKTVKLIVKEKEYKISTDKEEYTLEVDASIEPIVTLKNIEEYTIEIVDSEVAVVDGKTVKGLKEGETTLKVIALGKEDVFTEVKIIVIPKEYKLEVDKEEYIVRVSKTVEPIVTLKNIEEYTLEILDTEVAVVDGKTVKGVKVGETTLKISGNGTEIVKEVKIIVIPNESYSIDSSVIDTENVLTNITTETKVGNMISKITVEGLTIKVTNESGTELAKDANVGTGTKITFLSEDGSKYAEKEIIIRGDVTGDGVINSADLLKIVKYLKKTTTLNINAADATKDGLVNSADLLKIVKHLKKTSLIDFK